jgi:DNA helicase-2/ATP-dependent DNA helicase PcrA
MPLVTSSHPLLDPLNPQQKQVVLHHSGPVLVLAGAGSGKTRTLIHKLTYLITESICYPENILAVTFTNKAAREMRERMEQMMQASGKTEPSFLRGLHISTFHSFGASFLRRHAERLGYQGELSILDAAEQLQVIKSVFSEKNVSDSVLDPKYVAYMINQIKSDHPRMWTMHSPYFQRHHRGMALWDLWQAYEDRMRLQNSVDFSDLLAKTYQILVDFPELAERYQEQYRYILVDEYQDTNVIQYELIKLLSAKHRNVCVVGDEDQSIYSWRGADIRNILHFEKDFPEATTLRLEQNYRSTQVIVEASSALIAHNQERKGKTLFTENPKGDLIHYYQAMSDSEEARFVADGIESLHREGVPWSEIAVLYRTHAQSRLIEEQLRMRQVPYRVYGGLQFFERAEIKDVISYLRLIMNPRDNIAFLRIFNVPARGLGKSTRDKLVSVGSERQISLWEACYQLIHSGELNSSSSNKLKSFIQLLEELSQLKSSLPLLEFYTELLERSGYLAELKKENTDESRARLENLEQFAAVIEQFERESESPTLSDFLQEMSLVTDLEESDLSSSDGVVLSTAHMAKGLEFHSVFVIGLEEDLFPSRRSVDEGGMEEERRLFYVAMTRAKERLFLSAASRRRVWGEEQFREPSRVLSEIPAQYVYKVGSGISRLASRWNSSSSQRKGFSARLADSGFEVQEFPPLIAGMSLDEGAQRPKPHRARYQVGARVQHPHFGWGQVISTEGQGEEMRITVRFGSGDVKKFIARYAQLAVF